MSAALMQSPATARMNGWQMAIAPKTRLRITRRGRRVVGALAACGVAVLLALVAALSAAPAVASQDSSGTSFGYVVAAPGSSLWQLATELDPAQDPRDLVAEIVQLNQLRGADIVVGQPIAVPLRYTDSPTVMSGEELGL